MDTAHVTYLGGLRTEAIHIRSGQELVTDAPPDNKGRGEAFSPTDLLCVSLATCILTTAGWPAGQPCRVSTPVEQDADGWAVFDIVPL